MNITRPVRTVSTVKRSTYLKAISEPATTTATIQHIHPSGLDFYTGQLKTLLGLVPYCEEDKLWEDMDETISIKRVGQQHIFFSSIICNSLHSSLSNNERLSFGQWPYVWHPRIISGRQPSRSPCLWTAYNHQNSNRNTNQHSH
jgi:hypothetical protein